MAASIFRDCVFFLDPNARLGFPTALSGEQQSQDFAGASESELTTSITERGGLVLSGGCCACVHLHTYTSCTSTKPHLCGCGARRGLRVHGLLDLTPDALCGEQISTRAAAHTM